MKIRVLIMSLLFATTVFAQKFKTSYLQGSDAIGGYAISWDLDGDNDQDVIVADQYRLNVYENKGGGDFEKFTSEKNPFSNLFFSNSTALYPVVGDIDGDQVLDLIIATNDKINGSWSNTKTVFKHYELQNGKFQDKGKFISFLNALNLPPDQIPTLHQWNDESSMSLILTNNGGLNSFELNQSNEYSTFSSPTDFSFAVPVETTKRYQSVFIKDSDDGVDDLLTINYDKRKTRFFERTNSGVTEKVGNENPFEFLSVRPYFRGVKSIIYSDLSGDNVLDIWALEYNDVGLFYKGTGEDNEFVAFGGDKNPFTSLDDNIVLNAAIADLDKDEQPELYGTLNGEIKSFDYTGASLVNPFGEITDANSITFFDWDNDQDVDLFVGKIGNSGTALEYYQNDNGVFVLTNHPINSIVVPYYITPTFADFDGDELIDVLIGYGTNTPVAEDKVILFYKNDGVGGLTEVADSENPFSEFTVQLLGNHNQTKPSATDLNNDGHIDVVIGTAASGGKEGGIQVALNNGDNTYRHISAYSGEFARRQWPANRFDAIPWDIDADGDDDLFAYARHGGLLMYENTPTGYTVSQNNRIKIQNDPIFADSTNLGDTSYVSIKVAVKNENLELDSIVLSTWSFYKEEFFIESTSRLNDTITIQIGFKPTNPGISGQYLLDFYWNDKTSSKHFRLNLTGVGKGPLLSVYRKHPNGTIEFISNGQSYNFQVPIQPNTTITLDLEIKNTGTEPLIIDTSSIIFPPEISLADGYEIPMIPPMGDWGVEGTKIHLKIKVGNVEPFQTGFISFKSNDSSNEIFKFNIYIPDLRGVSSPATLYQPSLLKSTIDADFNLTPYTNSGLSPVIEIVEGTELINLNGRTVSILGTEGVVKFKMFVGDHPASETLGNEKFFFLTIADQPHENLPVIIEFPDHELELGWGTYQLSLNTNSAQLDSVHLEMVNGTEVADLDATIVGKLNLKQLGEAQVKITIYSKAPFESPVSKIAKISVVNHLGIEMKTQNWEVYPNPVASVLFVKGTEKAKKITIHSMDGKIVLEEINSNSISLEKLQKGMYLLEVKGSNGVFQTTVVKF